MIDKINMRGLSRRLLGGIGALGIGMAGTTFAFADEGSDLQALRSEVHDLQDKVHTLENQRGQDAGTGPELNAGPLKITIGGFTELAAIYRNRNEAADVLSSYTGIPFPNSPQYRMDEFRESARQSRLSILTQGPQLDGARAEAYFETDFLGAAQTANSKQSNSYNLRMRHIYADYTTDRGLQVLAGQTWSLLTLDKKGITPRTEVTPLTIDASYVPGFNYTRNPQIRIVQKFSDALSVGLSAESPQAIVAGTVPSGVVYNGAAGSGFNSANTYTTDPLPDFVVKVAADPGFGHYELYGINRTFRDSINGSNSSVSTMGFGGAASLPIIPGKFDVQLSALTGDGIGRYGASQLPDYTFSATGHIKPINETTALLGLIGHPSDALILYGYAGTERSTATAASLVGTTLYGYGNPRLDDSGCATLGGTCKAQPKSVTQFTIGGWWKFYRGPVGNMQLGLQASRTKLEAFSATDDGGKAPSTSINIVMASFRYYPYQN